MKTISWKYLFWIIFLLDLLNYDKFLGIVRLSNMSVETCLMVHSLFNLFGSLVGHHVQSFSDAQPFGQQELDRIDFFEFLNHFSTYKYSLTAVIVTVSPANCDAFKILCTFGHVSTELCRANAPWWKWIKIAVFAVYPPLRLYFNSFVLYCNFTIFRHQACELPTTALIYTVRDCWSPRTI